MNTIYTIGHSQHQLEHFLDMLKKNNVNYVIDVRSTPYSKFAQDYDRENIKKYLEDNEIHYTYMGKHFGARQENQSLYTSEGYLDFSKVEESKFFQDAIQNVMKGMETNRIALMCTEKQPIDCHRAILVGNAFFNKGCNVEHILPDGSVQTHGELNEELLDMYFPTRNQLHLFEVHTEEGDLKEAYKMRNKAIGYNISER